MFSEDLKMEADISFKADKSQVLSLCIEVLVLAFNKVLISLVQVPATSLSLNPSLD